MTNKTKLDSTIKELKLLDKKLPELCRETEKSQKDFWESFYPYTLEDAIKNLEDVKEYITKKI